MARITNGKVVAGEFFKDYEGKELGRIVGNFVNSFSFDKKGFIDGVKEAKDKEKILDVLLLWLIKLEFLKDNKYYDARNECSIEIGVKIAEVLHDEVEKTRAKYSYEGVILEEDYEMGSYLVDIEDEGNIENYEFVPIEKEVMFVETMAREHRTLQQSFSGLVFEVLTLFPEIEKRLQALGEKFWNVPMI